MCSLSGVLVEPGRKHSYGILLLPDGNSIVHIVIIIIIIIIISRLIVEMTERISKYNTIE